jgi:hypothetical protein
MDRALATTEVAGRRRTSPSCGGWRARGASRAGDVDTGLIEADLEALVAPVRHRRRDRAGRAGGDGARWRAGP